MPKFRFWQCAFLLRLSPSVESQRHQGHCTAGNTSDHRSMCARNPISGFSISGAGLGKPRKDGGFVALRPRFPHCCGSVLPPALFVLLWPVIASVHLWLGKKSREGRGEGAMPPPFKTICAPGYKSPGHSVSYPMSKGPPRRWWGGTNGNKQPHLTQALPYVCNGPQRKGR